MASDRWIPSSKLIAARRQAELRRLMLRKFALETWRSVKATREAQVIELELMYGDWDDESYA